MVLHKHFLGKISRLRESAISAFGEASQFVRNNPVLSGLIGSGIIATVGGVGAGIVRRRKKRKAKAPSRRRTTKRTRVTRRKGKKRSRSQTRIVRRASARGARIRHTKHGQPYIIMKDGRARFIRKKTSRLAKKRKGGLR